MNEDIRQRREHQIKGPLVRAVRRLRWADWRITYTGTSEGREVVIGPGRRHWFRWTAEREMRRRYGATR